MGLKGAIVNAGIAFLHNKPALRMKVRQAQWKALRRKYETLTAADTVDEKLILFEVFSGRRYACSPRAIYEYMCEEPRFSDYRFVWAFRPDAIQAAREIPALERAEIVERESEEYYHLIAAARYIVVNTRIPEYIDPKPEQTYLQCWHGTPLKRLGFDIMSDAQSANNTSAELAERYRIDCMKWDVFLSPNEFSSYHVANAFGLPEERRPEVIVELGYPRNDRVVRTCTDPELFARAKSEILKAIGAPEGKKYLLYAPTFRDTEYQAGVGYVLEETMLDFAGLQQSLGDGWCILFRPHYLIANRLDLAQYNGFVVNVADVADINDLYIVADCLCTDYSSVFFDYACTGRPLLFFWPDYERYANVLHGFYLDPHTIPGPKCLTQEAFRQAMAEVDSWFDVYGAEYEVFRQTFNPKDDGHATERVLEYLHL